MRKSSEKQKEWKAKHYRENKEEHLNTLRARRDKLAKRFFEYKKTLKCSKCEESNPICLDFHHINPENKKSTVTNLARKCSWERVMEEINKCTVLCSNCHRKHHFNNDNRMIVQREGLI